MDECEICKTPLEVTEGVCLVANLHSRRIIVCDLLARCFDVANKILQKTSGINTLKNCKELKKIYQQRSEDRKYQDGF